MLLFAYDPGFVALLASLFITRQVELQLFSLCSPSLLLVLGFR